jgi:hypothetical protein
MVLVCSSTSCQVGNILAAWLLRHTFPKSLCGLSDLTVAKEPQASAQPPNTRISHLVSHENLAALLVQRLEHGGELLTFGRVWFDIPQSVYDPYVFGAKLLFERIPLGDKGFELLHVEVLLRFIELFIEFGDVAVGFQLILVATDCLNEFLGILDSRFRELGVGFIRLRKRNDRCGDEERNGHKELEVHRPVLIGGSG